MSNEYGNKGGTTRPVSDVIDGTPGYDPKAGRFADDDLNDVLDEGHDDGRLTVEDTLDEPEHPSQPPEASGTGHGTPPPGDDNGYGAPPPKGGNKRKTLVLALGGVILFVVLMVVGAILMMGDRQPPPPALPPAPPIGAQEAVDLMENIFLDEHERAMAGQDSNFAGDWNDFSFEETIEPVSPVTPSWDESLDSIEATPVQPVMPEPVIQDEVIQGTPEQGTENPLADFGTGVGQDGHLTGAGADQQVPMEPTPSPGPGSATPAPMAGPGAGPGAQRPHPGDLSVRIDNLNDQMSSLLSAVSAIPPTISIIEQRVTRLENELLARSDGPTERSNEEPVRQERPSRVLEPVPFDGEIYTVRSGDSLSLIAQRHGLDWRDLASLNDMTAPYRLQVGQELRMVATARSAERAVVEASPPRVEPAGSIQIDPPPRHDQAAEPTAPPAATPSLTDGWEIVGAGSVRAILRSPSGENFVVGMGDHVPGLGIVLEIDPLEPGVRTSSGSIRW